MDEIKVTVVRYPDRANLMLRYVCPITGRQKHKSAKTNIMKDAVKAAGKWEKELREGTYAPPSRITWDEFRRRYEDELLPSRADETGRVVASVFNTVESILAPNRLAELTAARVSYYQSKLREGGRSEATIRTYLAHLKSSLGWAVKMGLLRAVPSIERPQRAKDSKMMKGRPITLEEFEWMLAKIADVVGEVAASAWRFYLRGLWASGLRLAESLELYWDRSDKLCVDLEGRRPMLRIPAALEKGNQDRILPMSPEFAEIVLAVPKADRHGRVFKLVNRDGQPRQFQDDWVGRVISAIGEKAGVKVNTTTKAGVETVKFASAHDLRRSFGERWAPRVMPQVLKELMRHESIDTTLKYYVGRNAQTTADVLWAAHESSSGNTFGNTHPKTTEGANETPDANRGHVER